MSSRGSGPTPKPEPAPGTALRPGDRIAYVGEPVYDAIIATGDEGVVVQVTDGWVHAEWPTVGVHSVPIAQVRPLAGHGV